MIRNFVAGVLWGTVVAGVGIGVISQIAPMPKSSLLSEGTVEGAVAEIYAQASGAETADPVMGEADAALSPAEADTAPASGENAPASGVVEAAEMDADAPALNGIAAQPDAPVLAEEAGTDSASVDDNAPKPASEIAAVTPDMAEGDVLSDAQPDVMPDAPEAPMVVAEAEAPALLQVELEPDTTPLPAVPAEEPLADSADLAPAPQDPPAAVDDGLLAPVAPATEGTPALISPEMTPDLDAAPAELAPDLPAVAPVPESEPELLPEPEPAAKPAVIALGEGATLAPETGMPSSVDGVETGRLPSIGGTADPATDGFVDAETPSLAPASDLPIDRFARRFEASADTKPLFAILLRDTGAADIDRNALAQLPFAVTFVIDPAQANAGEAAAIYRAAGQEVVVLSAGVSKGATASELEQSFQAFDDSVPEAVAVIDLPSAGFQDDRPVSSLVVPILAGQGRGLITFDRGLNAADQVARREGLRATTVFRQLDADNEAAPIIRRYLDRAAFKAAQEGGVVVMGDARPDTIAALMEWTVEGRASSVTLAPITALLQTK